MSSIVKDEANKEQKDFLFDPLAAAYYSQFSEFNPSKSSLSSILN